MRWGSHAGFSVPVRRASRAPPRTVVASAFGVRRAPSHSRSPSLRRGLRRCSWRPRTATRAPSSCCASWAPTSTNPPRHGCSRRPPLACRRVLTGAMADGARACAGRLHAAVRGRAEGPFRHGGAVASAGRGHQPCERGALRSTASVRRSSDQYLACDCAEWLHARVHRGQVRPHRHSRPAVPPGRGL